jgi:Mn2+/Fe2+ NRAMP family transporter
MNKPTRSAMLGAAFLMATSAVGPGFLTQTTLFTGRYGASFGFVILLSILLDLGAQLNIWRAVAQSGQRAPELAQSVLPGLGHLLALLIVFGGLVFNIGNIAGAALGLDALLGIGLPGAAIVSAMIGIGLFQVRNAGRALDLFATLLGFLMIALLLFIVVASRPPVAEALWRTIAPVNVDAAAVITLVGGTVGGYISFAGAHRLLDAGISGEGALRDVNHGAVRGLLLTALIRVLLFLAALGLISGGGTIDTANPAASLFRYAGGPVGYHLFGLMMWSAAMTSVVGAAYTSVSFLRPFSPWIERWAGQVVGVFILVSLAVFLFVGQPVRLLVFAGYLNGLILPVALAVILVAARRTQPRRLLVAGWVVVAILVGMGLLSQFR